MKYTSKWLVYCSGVREISLMIPLVSLNFSEYCIRGIRYASSLGKRQGYKEFEVTLVKLATKSRLKEYGASSENAFMPSLQWRHNKHNGVSNHQPRHCLFNRLFWRRSKETSKLRVTGHLCGEFTSDRWIPTQTASNEENVSIWWRHHAMTWWRHGKKSFPHSWPFARGILRCGFSLKRSVMLRFDASFLSILSKLLNKMSVSGETTWRPCDVIMVMNTWNLQATLWRMEYWHSRLGNTINAAGKCWPSLQLRHNESNGVSNHRRHECLLNRLFRRRSKKTSKLLVTGLCEGNPLVTSEFPTQRVSNAENVSIWWRHIGDACDDTTASSFWNNTIVFLHISIFHHSTIRSN